MRQTRNRKKNTIKFITLSFLLFIFSDITGKLFFPNNEAVNYMLRIALWGYCLITGGAIFYGAKKISTKRFNTIFLIIYLVYLVILRLSGFYTYGATELIGYKLSVAVMPLIGYLVRFKTVPFLRWYGRTTMRLTGARSVRDIKSVLSFLTLIIITLFLLVSAYKMSGSYYSAGKYVHQFIIEGTVNRNADKREPTRQYKNIFNDLNDVQLRAAIENGLKNPVLEENVIDNRKLMKIESCRKYKIADLTHSMPYLVPKAAKLVNDIGQAFQDSLFVRGYSRNHKIIVTSVLRTKNLVMELQKVNVNSSENSSHCYGTTFDVSYVNFLSPKTGKTASLEKMRQVLMQVMYDMRQQGLCYVKYETQQTCLHITVR